MMMMIYDRLVVVNWTPPGVNLAAYSGQAFAYATVLDYAPWNTLPDSLKNIRNLTLSTFQRHLETCFFSSS